MRIIKLASLILALCFTVAAQAQNYDKQPIPHGQTEKAMPEAFTNTQTYLQICVFGGVLSCQGSSSLGVRYTSGLANSVLASQYGCTYKGSTPARQASPGYDLYLCSGSSPLAGYTIFVLVEGDYSSSFAGTISAIYQP